MNEPFTLYRPTRVKVGQGKFEKTYASGRVTWGTLVVHEDYTAIIVDVNEDVAVEDVLRVTEAVT